MAGLSSKVGVLSSNIVFLQLVCALLHFLGIFRLFTELRASIPAILEQNPVQYFEILQNGFKIIFKVVTIKRMWWNQKEFADILNYIAIDKSLPSCSPKLQHKYTVSITCGIFMITGLVVAFGGHIVAPSSTWSKSWWNRSLVSDGRYAFFLVNRTELNTVPEMDQVSAGDYALALVSGIGLIDRFIMGFYFDLCLFFAVLTLWVTSQAFAKYLQDIMKDQVWTTLSLSQPTRNSQTAVEKPCEKWMELYQSYKGIRVLSQLINNAYGSMTTAFIAESILYHSMSMDAILLTKNVFIQARLLFFLVSSSATYIFSADICSQMDTLKVWLSKDENRHSVPLDELNIVLHELHTNVIGIRGSNIFTITYSLVWNMVTTVVTYFIICVQSRVNPWRS